MRALPGLAPLREGEKLAPRFPGVNAPGGPRVETSSLRQKAVVLTNDMLGFLERNHCARGAGGPLERLRKHTEAAAATREQAAAGQTG